MEYPYIKNITHEKVQSLAGLVNAEDGQIVSKTLAQNEAVSVTLFAFAKGEEISTHDSTGDAMVTVLEGTGRFTVDGVEHLQAKFSSCRRKSRTPFMHRKHLNGC